ncbi:MAG: hypothetical protein AAGD25_35595 [Cyanobacteria bacterium P01_F01_bin.150]
MTSEMITEAALELDALDVEDELEDFTADLVALKQNEEILRRLFSQPLGQWSDLMSLVDERGSVSTVLQTLAEKCDGSLQITWLEHPDLNTGYCLVLFYVDSLAWNNLALYNKGRLSP